MGEDLNPIGLAQKYLGKTPDGLVDMETWERMEYLTDSVVLEEIPVDDFREMLLAFLPPCSTAQIVTCTDQGVADLVTFMGEMRGRTFISLCSGGTMRSPAIAELVHEGGV